MRWVVHALIMATHGTTPHLLNQAPPRRTGAPLTLLNRVHERALPAAIRCCIITLVHEPSLGVIGAEGKSSQVSGLAPFIWSHVHLTKWIAPQSKVLGRLIARVWWNETRALKLMRTLNLMRAIGLTPMLGLKQALKLSGWKLIPARRYRLRYQDLAS